MITSEQGQKIYEFLLTQNSPVPRDTIARVLNLHPIKIRQAKQWAWDNHKAVIVSDYDNGFFLASKSDHIEESLRREYRAAITQLQTCKRYKQMIKYFREKEGVETPENQLPLTVEEQELVEEFGQLSLL